MNTKPKSAEEWYDESDTKWGNGRCSMTKGTIKAIQLDAAKAGMKMAAEEAVTHPVGVSAKDWSDYCRGRNDAAKAILTAADNLKESDL